MNNIFLTVPGLGSSYLMGEILSKYSEGLCIPYNNLDVIKNLSNKNIILVKKHIGSNTYSPELIEHLRKRNNKIIYIVLDGFSVCGDQFIKKLNKYKFLYDLVFFSSKFSAEKFDGIVNAKVLRHIWDPNLKYNTSNNFNLCYFGTSREDKIFLHNNINIKKINSSKKDKNIFYRELLNYNCHYSVRGQDWAEFKYGVNTKLSSAAATNSNIVCSKDNAFIELLPQYDYYVDNNRVETVIDMINRCKTEFGSKKWNDNLLKLKKIKEETDPRVIGKELLSFLN